ncbi:hypothetical protein PLESTB_000777200 [Pleodorina starrii]|uniref:Uncharacterized protein n=1 Tax=Pleodorina starrii TaxID=330485 RepID=A0A9W6BL05_9CHLO|nr:hypothetical protein PLESTM_000507400 [Pleodorina starrii]GLC53695.1 hypothetical protein PLESTB_000777200 [Pleodorina starrii]GLC72879.1 hypothetical protein PLESTF_001305200 [Pleodorina starrii]
MGPSRGLRFVWARVIGGGNHRLAAVIGESARRQCLLVGGGRPGLGALRPAWHGMTIKLWKHSNEDVGWAVRNRRQLLRLRDPVVAGLVRSGSPVRSAAVLCHELMARMRDPWVGPAAA